MLHWLSGLSTRFGRWFSRAHEPLSQVRYPAATNSAYYQDVHQTNEAYKINNWLISEIDSIISAQPKSLLEVGCGNGRFLAAIKDRVPNVIGVDWAESPVLHQLGISGNFQRCDITQDNLPQVDLVCSGDVLEHIPPHLLTSTLQRLHDAGGEQYHMIACYDDAHSHLSIMEPRMWLSVFRAMSERYRIINTHFRRDDPSQPVCVISTFEPTSPPKL